MANSRNGNSAPKPGDKWRIIIAEMDRLGLKYEFDPHYDLRQLDVRSRRVQVRDDVNVAPKDKVNTYAIQMKAPDADFPPIVVTRDHWTVDGNTRGAAKRLNSENFFHAFVLEISEADADDHEKRLLQILGATLNSNAGLALTAAERRKSVEAMVAEGWNGESIARALGIGPSVVTQVKRELEARTKFDKIGLAIDPKLSLNSLRALGAPAVVGLNDEPFKELADLTKTAGLGAAEVQSIARSMRDAGSDVMALELIEGQRTEMEERIRHHALTGNGKPPHSAMLRRSLGHIIAYDGKEQLAVEKTPDNVGKHLDAIDKARAILQRIRKLQIDAAKQQPVRPAKAAE
jgi:hypothetical protein